MIKTRILFTLLGAGLMAAVMSIAEPHHPNIAAAQEFCNHAIEKISAAQVANEFDMRGHAQKAKELLMSAKGELHEAYIAAGR
jgi:hypothetical protein